MPQSIKVRDTDDDGTDDLTLAYDAAGNLTDDGKDYKYVYDAFGRLRKVNNQSDVLVAEYTYNGLGYRTGWHYDVDGDGTVEANTAGNSDDPWFHWVYDAQWRKVATYRTLHYHASGGWTIDGDPKEQFVYHAAGLAGAGGSSYIDSVILRDRDANTAWEDQADGTLEERVYLCQNWRADVVALMTSDGHLINQVRYDPYGVPFGIAKTDLDGDGDVDGDDYTRFSTLHSGGTHPYADWNFDGTVNTSDITAFLNDYNADTGLGRGDPGYDWSETGGALRKAYAGYEIDPVLTGSEGWESVYHVRHRVYLSTLGRWTRRDPLGYVDGMSSYGYVLSAPIHFTDPLGTHSRQPSDLDCDNPCRPPCDHEWGPLAILQSSDSCTECTSYKRTVGVFKGRNYRLSDDPLSTTRYNTVGIFLQGTADNTGAKGYANSVFYHTAVINFVESVSYLGSVNSPFKFLVACTPDYVPVVQEMSGIPPSSGWLELAPGDYPIYGRVRFSWKAHRSEESPCVTVEVKISANMKHYNRGRTWFAWPPSQWNDDNVFRLGVDKYKGHAGGSVSVSWTWCCDGCMLL